MVHLSLGDSARSGESGLGWDKFFVFSFSGVGICCQLATRANYHWLQLSVRKSRQLALVFNDEVMPISGCMKIETFFLNPSPVCLSLPVFSLYEHRLHCSLFGMSSCYDCLM